jgi:hypothetical protein
VNRRTSGPTVGIVAAAVLTCADRLEQELLGRPAIYVPQAIARRLFAPSVERRRRMVACGMLLRAAYSASWGLLYSRLREGFPRSPVKAGIEFGAGICAFELLAMPAVRAVPPLREWPRREIALLFAHTLSFGITAALLYDRLVARGLVHSRAAANAHPLSEPS